MPSSSPSLRFTLLGKQGSGKGTQGRRIASFYGIPKISTGDMIRALLRQQRELSSEVRSGVDSGALAPEPVVRKLVAAAISVQVDQRKGFVLDGFPRNVDQFRFLEEILGSDALTAAIYLRVPDEMALQRISRRLTCDSCGETYSASSEYSIKTPCRYCDGILIRRNDDASDVAARRLQLYRCLTKPVVGLYRNQGTLLEVDATGSPDEILRRIINEIGSPGATPREISDW